MISLGGDSILVRGDDGRLEPHPLGALADEVHEALSLVGRGDDGIADDLIRVVRHYAATAVRNGRVMAGEEVRRLVLRILRDAGCAEAAAVMAPNDLGAIVGELVANDVDAMAEVLGTDPRFVGLDRHGLAAAVAQVLTAAGLPGTTAAGVVEIATSVILAKRQAETPDESPSVPPAGSYWLLTGDNWGGLLPDELQAAVADGRLRLYPVSRLAPMVQVIVDLRRFPDNGTELLLLPAVDDLVLLLAETLARVPAVLAESSPDVTVGSVRGSLRLLGLEVVAFERLQLGGAQLYSFAAEIQARVAGRLSGLAWLRVDCATGQAASSATRHASSSTDFAAPNE